MFYIYDLEYHCQFSSTARLEVLILNILIL